MPIPDYQTLMKPLLLKLADGQIHSMTNLIQKLADEFKLTEEERAARIASGRRTVFENRVWWARTYLKKAGLIQSPERGRVSITERGKEVLRENPDRIDNDYLMRFPEFKDFRKRTKVDPVDPPEEQIDRALEQLRSAVTGELLERIRNLSPSAFERLVLDLLLKMGYGGPQLEAGELTGGSGDEGIDGVIRQDPLGLDTIYLQAKRWSQSVGRPEIQKFVGALAGKKAKKGVFLTTSEFTKDARDYAKGLSEKVVLLDGRDLAQLMYEYGLGVSVVRTLEIKRVDTDYFSDLSGEGE
ncbi:restriction endonuclease [Thermus antranikianii]|uniref:Restriction endonuclease n=2 Tax=Thermus antranikianii TaxID=88190 RepID=A0ABY7RSJ0_9DEIN|nr:restriction endonuclease [Thermus antranikianii]